MKDIICNEALHSEPPENRMDDTTTKTTNTKTNTNTNTAPSNLQYNGYIDRLPLK